MELSNKFDEKSVYHDGRYYFPQDESKLVKQDDTLKATIQVVYYNGKWMQDTHYICPILYLDLLTYFVKNK